MRVLNEDSMVDIEGGSIWAYWTSGNCFNCRLTIGTIVLGCWAFWEWIAYVGIAAAVEFLAGCAADASFPDTLQWVLDQFSEGLSYCGPCWEDIKE